MNLRGPMRHIQRAAASQHVRAVRHKYMHCGCREDWLYRIELLIGCKGKGSHSSVSSLHRPFTAIRLYSHPSGRRWESTR